MDGDAHHIELKIEVAEPMELGDFVGAFTALGSEFERYSRQAGREDHARLYVSEVRPGSIVAILVPIVKAFREIADGAEKINALVEFVERYKAKLGAYLNPGGRAEGVTKGEINDLIDQVAVVSRQGRSSLRVAAIESIDGRKRTRAVFAFDTDQARDIMENAQLHRRDIVNSSLDVRERVLMTFTRTDRRSSRIGKRSGEQVSIESINSRHVPIIYDSELAEQAIKHEIADAQDNVYKKGFVVDVSLEEMNGRLVAYRVRHLHQVIDLPDEDDDPSP